MAFCNLEMQEVNFYFITIKIVFKDTWLIFFLFLVDAYCEAELLIFILLFSDRYGINDLNLGHCVP